MKVVEGTFGQKEDDRTPLEILTSHLEKTDLKDVKGDFLF